MEIAAMEPNRGGLPKTVSQLYPSKWLTAADLERPVTATIIAVDLEELRQADGEKEMKLVVTFRNATKRWVTNLTQCRRMAELLETEVFAGWVGARVTLARGKAANGRDTIVVTHAARLPSEARQAAQPADNPRDQGPVGAMGDEGAAALWAGFWRPPASKVFSATKMS